MHLLYIDGSGSVRNPNESYFILAGVAVFERGIFHLIRQLDDIVEEFGFENPESVELHGSPMYNGRGPPWEDMHRRDREPMIHKALAAMQGSRAAARLFGVAIHKATLSPNDPVERAFEEICNRFNLYLQRMFHRRGRNPDDRQRGLVIMDKSSYEETLQALATEFRVNGTRWGHLLNMAEVPLFVNSQASRLIQLADLVAFAVWRRYEYHDGRFLDPILPYFDAEGGVIHGLFHYRPREDVCYCPACMSREAKNTAL